MGLAFQPTAMKQTLPADVFLVSQQKISTHFLFLPENFSISPRVILLSNSLLVNWKVQNRNRFILQVFLIRTVFVLSPIFYPIHPMGFQGLLSNLLVSDVQSEVLIRSYSNACHVQWPSDVSISSKWNITSICPRICSVFPRKSLKDFLARTVILIMPHLINPAKILLSRIMRTNVSTGYGIKDHFR